MTNFNLIAKVCTKNNKQDCQNISQIHPISTLDYLAQVRDIENLNSYSVSVWLINYGNWAIEVHSILKSTLLVTGKLKFTNK